MSNRKRWRQNRRALLDEVSDCQLVVLAANRVMQRNNDATYRFEQDSTFFYYTGLEEPNLLYAADVHSGDEWLIAPSLSEAERTFDGYVPLDELQARSGLTVHSQTEGWRRIEQALSGHRSATVGVAKQLSKQRGRLSMNDAHRRLLKRLRALKNRPQLKDITVVIANQRTIKQPWELELIQQAVDITAKALDGMASSLATYGYEYEVEADITAAFRRRGARHAYEPIVANGPNALTLHYVKNDARLARDELLLIDVGAQVSHYCADVTRTYPLGGAFSPRQLEIYKAVLELQAYCMQLLKPGLHFVDYVQKVDAQTKKVLNQLRLPVEKLRRYAPHGISHGLGLDVHDQLSHESFQPGMVLTVEPGIYVQEEGIGVRIEDDVVITDVGYRILSANIPREPAIIEQLISR